jgi:hypothetical protein
MPVSAALDHRSSAIEPVEIRALDHRSSAIEPVEIRALDHRFDHRRDL